MSAPATTSTRYYQQRPRRIPPEMVSDWQLEQCSVFAALLLDRLITHADDQGRLQGIPTAVKAMCFPARPVTASKIAKALEELAETGWITRYVKDRLALIQIVRWWDLQGTHERRAYPSLYPAPDGYTGDRVYGLVGTENDRNSVGPRQRPVDDRPSDLPF